MALEDWMAQYQDRPLGELHLPGSHDAGTTKDWNEYTVGGSESNAATQDLTIPEQLAVGTRFFDLRLAVKKNAVVAHHTTAGQGAFSWSTVDEVLAEAARFCATHRTEVVIFRISHTSEKTRAHEIVKASGQGSLHTGTGNLCKKTLTQIVSQGGGLVCILEEKVFGGVIDQTAGVHAYSKYVAAANDHGIATCGTYTRTHKLHDVVRNGLKGQYEHNERHNPGAHDHLWQVYWQKTYMNPLSKGIERGTTKKTNFARGDGKVHGGTHAATDYMLHLMSTMKPVGNEDFTVQKEESHRQFQVGPVGIGKKVVTQQKVMYSTLGVRNYSLPNILSYDFVNEDVNKQIIAMNQPSLQAVLDGDV